MAESISVTGVIGTEPQRGTTAQGKPFINFRLVSTTRRYNDTSNTWEDAGTNWFRVAAYGNLARNLGASFSKGQRVVVVGRLHINEWKSGEKSGIAVEVVAESAGHDLAWGTTTFTRALAATGSQRITDEQPQSAAPQQMPDLVTG